MVCGDCRVLVSRQAPAQCSWKWIARQSSLDYVVSLVREQTWVTHYGGGILLLSMCLGGQCLVDCLVVFVETDF